MPGIFGKNKSANARRSGKEYKTPALQVAEERSDERTVRGQEQVFNILRIEHIISYFLRPSCLERIYTV